MKNITFNSVVVCPTTITLNGTDVTVLDYPFPIRLLDNNNGGFKTFNQLAQELDMSYPLSNDQSYVALYLSLSSVRDEDIAFKQLLIDCGVTKGNDDFTVSPDSQMAWFLTIPEFVNQFRNVSPLFKTEKIL